MTSKFERLTPQGKVGAKSAVAARGIVFQDAGIHPPLVPRIDTAKLELSPREREVLSLSATGLSSAEIATRLSIAPGTVKHYQEQARVKLRTHSTTEAISKAIGKGEINPPGIIYTKKLQHSSRRERRGSLTEFQRKILQSFANGLSYERVAEVCMTSKKGALQEMYRVRRFLGVETSSQAVLVGVDVGLVDLDEATKDYDLKLINLLTQDEREILKKTIEKNGAGSSNGEIAKALSFAEGTIRNKRTRIDEKLGVNFRIDGHLQALLIYLAADKKGMLQEKAK